MKVTKNAFDFRNFRLGVDFLYPKSKLIFNVFQLGVCTSGAIIPYSSLKLQGRFLAPFKAASFSGKKKQTLNFELNLIRRH